MLANFDQNDAISQFTQAFLHSSISLKTLLNNVKTNYGQDAYNTLINQLNQRNNLNPVIHFHLAEQNMYGSQRLGVRNYDRNDMYTEYELDEKANISQIARSVLN